MQHRWKWTAGVAAAFPILAIGGWVVFHNLGTGAQASPQAAPRAAFYQTEQEWIVWQTVRTIAAGASAMRSRDTQSVPDVTVRTRSASALELLNAATLDVALGNAPAQAITISEHVWSPSAYVNVARSLLPDKVPQPAGDAGPGAAALLEALTTPRVEVILAEEARVSAALAARPLDPAGHEDAALLVGTLALREAAEWFTDLRPLLCRMTAHLSLARALAPARAPGVSAQVAAVIVAALVGREDLALRELGAWGRELPPAQAAWARVLRLRITGDWRQVKVDRSASLLERLEYARALRGRVSPSRMLAFLEDQGDLEPIADWHRIALNDIWTSFSVEAGNWFAEDGLVLDLDELKKVWERYHQGPSSLDAMLSSLDAPAAASYRAIDWEAWAGFLERQLCAQLAASSRHRAHLGIDREGKEWLEEVKPFRQLRLFPFVLKKACRTEVQYHEALALVRKAAAAYPVLFTAALADVAGSVPDFVKQRESLDHEVAWLTPHVPTGTTFELVFRTLRRGCKRPVPLPQVERWAKQAPHDFWLSWSVVFVRADSVPTFADAKPSLSTVLDYDRRASKWMFDYLQGPADDHLDMADAMCRIEADECSKLAVELLFNDRNAEAAAVYDAYARDARDTVGVSNEIGWLVRYYWDTENRERAVQLAEQARATGSAEGMAIYGELLERQGRVEEALPVFEAIAERYDSKWHLAIHYLRAAARTRDAKWVERAEKSVPDYFSEGIQPVEGAWLPAPPPDGVTFVTFGARAARTGLGPADIVVAVDGYRVHNVAQYRLVMRSGFSPKVPFVVWRDGRYQAVQANVPQRWMGIGLDNFPSALKRRLEVKSRLTPGKWKWSGRRGQ